MPTSSTNHSLVGSRYTVTPAAFVDVRRFQFFRERQFDVRDDLYAERLARAQRSITTANSSTGGAANSTNGFGVATPRVPDQLLLPSPPASAGGFPLSATPMLTGVVGGGPMFPPTPIDTAITPNTLGRGLIAPPPMLLTMSSAQASGGGGAIATFGVPTTASSNHREGRATPRGGTAPLKPLFNTEGDIIWSSGRSRAMEACDRSQAQYDIHKQDAMDMAEDEDLGLSLRENSKNTRGPMSSSVHQQQQDQSRRVQPPSSRQSLMLTSGRSGEHQGRLSFSNTVTEAGMLQHALMLNTAIPAGELPSMAGTPCSSVSERGLRVLAFMPSKPTTSQSARFVPKSPFQLLPGGAGMKNVAGMSDNSLVSPRPRNLDSSLSSSTTASMVLEGGRRRSSIRSRNARLARQLEKQSKALQQRIYALNAGEAIHREDLTRMGGRMLAGLGCVEEMNAFLSELPPLPHASHYGNIHSMELIAEVPLDQVTSAIAAAHAKTAPPGSMPNDTSRQVNEEVRWGALLKKDVAQTAAEEEARRRELKAMKSHMAATARGNTQHTSNAHVAPPRAPDHSHYTPEAPSARKAALSPTVTVDDIAMMADARIASELAGRALASIGAQHHKYTEELEEKEEQEKETIRTILASDSSSAGGPQRRKGGATGAKGGPASAFTEKVVSKRNAVVDTTALEARMARGGNTDMSLLGAQAMVDLKLFRKDQELFALTGEDTDPRTYPTFPFSKGELLSPRDDGFGISLFDNKKDVEDKAYNSAQYHQQNLSDKLERTHILRRMLGEVFNKKQQQQGTLGGRPNGTSNSKVPMPPPPPTTSARREEDEDVLSEREDWQRWKRAAGAMPSDLQRGDGGERTRKEQVYTWHQVTKEHNVPDMGRVAM